MSYLDNQKIYEKDLFQALLAQQCGRYDDMITSLENLLKQRNKDFSPEERELLSFGYISYINTQRKSLYMVMAYETKEKKKENSKFISYIRDYRKEVESNYTKVGQKLNNSLDIIIKKAETKEANIFYRKLKGDINRYMGEYAKEDLRDRIIKDGLNGYHEALNMAKDFPVMNKLYLGLVLNFSLFYYEVIGERRNAIKISEECINKVIKELEKNKDEKVEDKIVNEIIELIKENLKNWKLEEDKEDLN